MRRLMAKWALIISAGLLAGCAVGPDFKRPAPPDVSGYTASPLSTTDSTAIAGGEAQQFVVGRDIPGEWWTLFQSEPLNTLIEQALKANPDLQAAQATLRVAQETVDAGRGAYFPSVDAGVTATRQKQLNNGTDPSTGTTTFSLHTAQVSVAYAPDVFGGTRRQIESLLAQTEARRFQLEAVQLTLTSNVVVAAIQEAALRAQIDATREIIATNSNLVQLLRSLYAKGKASKLDMAAQESQLAQVTATLPPLFKQLAQQRNLLNALAGRFPSEQLAATFTLDSLQLPRELPLSLPSKLVEQRPDVRAAEAQLHAASGQIGAATANRLPQLTLSANVGRQSSGFDGLIHSGVGVWGIAAGLTQPLFHGGALLHQQRAAEAAFDVAAAQYRSTVIAAFQNVADTLAALQHDADALKAAAAAVESARVALDLARRQMQTGSGSPLALLNTQQTYQQAVINLIQAQANRYADTAALFQALGGGWWNRGGIQAVQSTVETRPRNSDKEE